MASSPTQAQLAAIEARFHELIRQQAVDQGGLTLEVELPVLSADLRDYAAQLWFPVPGMYGGFSYRLVIEGDTPVLLSKSWCRVVEGSGPEHRITESTTELVAENSV